VRQYTRQLSPKGYLFHFQVWFLVGLRPKTGTQKKSNNSNLYSYLGLRLQTRKIGMSFTIARSSYGGLGLFAAERVVAGTKFLGAEYDGRLMTRETAQGLPDTRWVRHLEADLYIDGQTVSQMSQPETDPKIAAQAPGKGALVNVSKRKWNVNIKKRFSRKAQAWPYLVADHSTRRKTQHAPLVSSCWIELVAAKTIEAGEELLLRTYGPQYDWASNSEIID
jgi:hypothetical protein